MPMCKACRVEPDPERKPVEVARLGLHAHTCSECGKLRTCYQDPCPARARGDNARDPRQVLPTWICFVCVDAAETEVPIEWSPSQHGEKEKAAA
jgi:hypothetical protein